MKTAVSTLWLMMTPARQREKNMIDMGTYIFIFERLSVINKILNLDFLKCRAVKFLEYVPSIFFLSTEYKSKLLRDLLKFLLELKINKE